MRTPIILTGIATTAAAIVAVYALTNISTPAERPSTILAAAPAAAQRGAVDIPLPAIPAIPGASPAPAAQQGEASASPMTPRSEASTPGMAITAQQATAAAIALQPGTALGTEHTTQYGEGTWVVHLQTDGGGLIDAYVSETSGAVLGWTVLAPEIQQDPNTGQSGSSAAQQPETTAGPEDDEHEDDEHEDDDHEDDDHEDDEHEDGDHDNDDD